ncbi:MAG: IDEAL domain-containing protein [Sporolactobacillus sp.]
MEQQSIWSKGDWVKGRTVNGELMHGYIEDFDDEDGTVKVHVVACDRLSTVGRTIETLSYLIKPFPALPLTSRQLRSLADLALATGDREWFMALSSQLAAKKNNNLTGRTDVGCRSASR